MCKMKCAMCSVLYVYNMFLINTKTQRIHKDTEKTINIITPNSIFHITPLLKKCNPVDNSKKLYFFKTHVDNFMTYTFLSTSYTRKIFIHNLLKFIYVISLLKILSSYPQHLLLLLKKYIEKEY
jgi:hypothetical protein